MKARIESFVGTETCSVHGSYEFRAMRVGKTIVGKVCPQCQRASFALAQTKNEERAVKEAQVQRIARLQAAGVPYAFLNAEIDNFEANSDRSRKVVDLVGKYLANFKIVLGRRPAAGMVFKGVPGSGKTHMGCAMISKLTSMGFSAGYISAPQFLTACEDARHGRHDLSASKLIALHASPQLLVIDEFGAHQTKDSDYQALFSLVDMRYQANLATVLITNLAYQAPGEQLAAAKGHLDQIIDERLIERIRGGGGPIFSFDWPSERRKKTSDIAIS